MRLASEELLQEYLKITPMEAESMVVAKEVPPDPGDCKVMEPKLSPMLPPKVEIEYFSPHARPYGYRILPLVERFLYIFLNNKAQQHFKYNR